MSNKYWIGFFLFLAGILGFVFLIDRMPEELPLREASILKVALEHEARIDKLIATQNIDEKSDLAQKYILDSQVWLAEMTDFIKYLQNLKSEVFLTTRNQTIIAGKIRTTLAQIEIITETRIMLQNALQGQMEPRHRALGEMVFDKRLPALFPNMK
ncbi:MAG: hypothetical protein H3C47_12750 [Candidatus Cloacimonetes bacterium]|nr:hypothetical protein [Candidatus Cloacimonadota bacterium]